MLGIKTAGSFQLKIKKEKLKNEVKY